MFVSFNLHPPLVLSVTESLNITHVAQRNKSAILLQNYKGKWVWCPWDIIHNTGRANDEVCAIPYGACFSEYNINSPCLFLQKLQDLNYKTV